MRIVLDTNVLVRAAAASTSPAAVLLSRIRDDEKQTLVLSRHILVEVRDVLSRTYFRDRCHVTAERLDRFCQAVERIANLYEPALRPAIILSDPDDDQVLHTAIAGRAEALCTWDRHFYHPDVMEHCRRHGIRVLKDWGLLKELDDS